MKERLVHLLNSLTAKYVAVFALLVAVPAIGISWYLLDSSYNDNKAALVSEQQERARQLARRIDGKLEDEAKRLAASRNGSSAPHRVVSVHCAPATRTGLPRFRDGRGKRLRPE